MKLVVRIDDTDVITAFTEAAMRHGLTPIPNAINDVRLGVVMETILHGEMVADLTNWFEERIANAGNDFGALLLPSPRSTCKYTIFGPQGQFVQMVEINIESIDLMKSTVASLGGTMEIVIE